MKLLFYIGSIISMAIIPLISDLNEQSDLTESLLDYKYIAFQDTSRMNIPIKVDSFYLDIISPSLGVQYYKDGIVFLASSKNTIKMVPEHISFGTNEAYVALPGDSTIGTKYLLFPTTSFPYPCDAFTFDKDYKIMYFTRSSKTSGKEQIYEVAISSGSNTQINLSEKNDPLPFCNDGFNYTHPTLSANGDLMIFASDRRGSVGKQDLFISKKEGESWSVPQNMGSEINTRGNELFPFLDSNNNLFFSSDGLPGLGGFDIFTCQFNGKSWEKPLNLTQLINSVNDELAFTMSKIDGKSGFFTSRQKSGRKILQLYKVSLNSSDKLDNYKNLSEVIFNTVLQKPEFTAMKSDDSTQILKTVVAEEKKDIRPLIIPVKADTVPVGEPKTAELRTEAKKEIVLKTEEKKEVVIYRIQFETTNGSKGSYKLTVNNKVYTTYEYFYKGAYRSTVGEFNSLSEASAFQNTLRKSGYPGSFVVAFVNNVRSLDPKLFK
jgi:hypothetical protein